VRGVPGKSTTLAEIFSDSASFGATHPPVLGGGQSVVTDYSPGVAVHIARVRVDPETGRVEPLRFISVQDVGRAINPATVESQMHGGAVQAVGWGLYERILWDEQGTPLTASLMDYAIPRRASHLVWTPAWSKCHQSLDRTAQRVWASRRSFRAPPR